MLLKPALTTLFLCFCCFFSFGQKEEVEEKLDVVHLTNGSVFQGEILEYERGKVLKIKLQDGQILEVEDEKIRKIVQSDGLVEDSDLLKKEKQPAVLKTDGWYNTTYTSFASGQNRFDQFTLGAGVHNVTGKHLNNTFALGLGIGIDNYSRRGETILPIYSELKVIPFQKAKQFYLIGSAGYGFAFKREQFGIQEARGGYMLHPAIGYRSGTADGTNVTIDIGLKLQDAYFKEELPNRDVETRDIVFNRITIRIGLTLWK